MGFLMIQVKSPHVTFCLDICVPALVALTVARTLFKRWYVGCCFDWPVSHTNLLTCEVVCYWEVAPLGGGTLPWVAHCRVRLDLGTGSVFHILLVLGGCTQNTQPRACGAAAVCHGSCCPSCWCQTDVAISRAFIAAALPQADLSPDNALTSLSSPCQVVVAYSSGANGLITHMRMSGDANGISRSPLLLHALLSCVLPTDVLWLAGRLVL